jgi:hypothetical protein
MAIEPVGLAQEALGPIALDCSADAPRSHDDDSVLRRSPADGHYHEPPRRSFAGVEHGANLALAPELETGGES